MPTYKNTTQQILQLQLSHSNDYTLIKPFETVTSEIIHNITGLEQISPAPYFNPILSQSNITLANSSDSITIPINSNTTNIEFINISDNIIFFYFQSTDNTPPYIITPGASRTFTKFNRYFNQLIIKSSDTITTNQVFLTQYIE